MFNLYTPRRAEKIIRKYDAQIRTIGRKYNIPPSAIKAILYQELIRIDLMDVLTDLAVWTGLFGKKDSSTGYAQIFGWVALNAANFALDHDLADYASLGLDVSHRLSPEDSRDVRMVWKKIFRDPFANIEFCVLNLLCAAEEMTGHTDFAAFSEEELKLVLTRYNADIRQVTKYGEAAYADCLRYEKETEKC